MTIRSRFFDSEAGDRVYTSDAWKEIFQRIVGEGYVKEVESGLQVTEANPASMNVSVGLGAAWAQGRFFEVYSAVENRAIAASDPTNPRIDRVVLRLSYTNRTITLAVLTGAPAALPAAPALTRDANTYEMSLAKVSVGAGVTSIVNANITDERDVAAVCGRARPIVGPKASAVTYEGATNLLGATVEAALDELDAEKAAIADVILKSLIDAKGNIIVGIGDNAVAVKAVGADGTVLKAKAANSDGLEWGAVAVGDLLDWQFVRKTVNETVNNSTTLQDDDHLFLSTGANETWEFHGLLMKDNDSSPDILYTFVGPTGSAGNLGHVAGETGADGDNTSLGGTLAIQTGQSGVGRSTAIFHGIIRNGATAGNLKLQWAQASATAADSVLITDSYLIGRKVA